MREFNMENAVSIFSDYTASAQSLWGLFVVAGFSAVGFGASQDEFTVGTAILLTIAYAAFAVAHLRVVLRNVAVREAIAGEILGRLASAPGEVTDYPTSVAAGLTIGFGRTFAVILHVVIDGCVIAVTLGNAGLWDLNSATMALM